MKAMLSSEFLQEYKAGKREFDGINLQYIDLSGVNLKDIIIKNSKMFVVAFYDCNLTNAKFINCEMVYGSFYGGNLTGALFEKCRMDLMLFENTVFRKTKMLKSSITWSGFFGGILAELDLSSSTLIKVLTDISQVTQDYIDGAMGRIGPVINSLDISIRAKIKEEMERDAAKYGVEIKDRHGEKSSYAKDSSSYSKTDGVYGSGMRQSIQTIINAYNETNAYKTKKKGYEQDSKY